MNIPTPSQEPQTILYWCRTSEPTVQEKLTQQDPHTERNECIHQMLHSNIEKSLEAFPGSNTTILQICEDEVQQKIFAVFNYKDPHYVSHRHTYTSTHCEEIYNHVAQILSQYTNPNTEK